MYYYNELEKVPLERRISVFKRNDRESPKGQRPLPNNMSSYVVRDLYPYKGHTGYFTTVLVKINIQLATDYINILEVRCIETYIDFLRLWNKLITLLHLPKLYLYNGDCYSQRIIREIKKHKAEKEYPYYIGYNVLEKEDKMKGIVWPYEKVLYVLENTPSNLYEEICSYWTFERECNNGITDFLEVDPRGAGMRIYAHKAEYDKHLQGEELVKAYLREEPMIELIYARCEQEVEIRINESLISVDEVIARIRKGLEPMQWRLEVEL